MVKQRYPKSVALTPVENAMVERLKKAGVKVIDIFRDGLALNARKVRRDKD